ncbi:MAG: Asp23/Gls24 family envelope stress response protein [Bacillota bacterium]|jgi:uncharacterized alkaline shock family protein YloU|nr:Asp23/Gls24 family envelope stress response protein [Bacillota bacterium]HOB91760.1 Asp23/Gls24 family envelope stress response protein [Bacillota bacterium]HPZ55216.1 Asp23/Gls24 family envelope stress response protein [Bacillota bacterium]HQD18631.1 Asp23/Gls24 family envelope stress response protein [Bacillota bacterium]
MSKKMSTEYGQICISDDVIAIISGIAASECYGLVGMASRNLQDGISELVGMDNLQKGVEVQLDGDEVRIILHIIVEYGTRITEVAHNVMGKVKYVIESMTGLRVMGVDIVVQGVRVASPRDEAGRGA